MPRRNNRRHAADPLQFERPLGACEGCHQAPWTRWVEFPSMPDYALGSGMFRLCGPCGEFADDLIAHAETTGAAL